ncbi:sensor domain-containing protein [Paenibacillus sanguinis]|uniref:sensor domain-containing protein n=1 Tax=Paenibacillus sanguinis TaxID=225906 RepID=UPI0003682B9B|nr:sensor domain-containing protein [Paenibacillus sanguinis]
MKATTEAPAMAKMGKVSWALFNSKTYATILYFLLSLPMGIIYLTLAITGLVLSVALTPIFIGIPMFFGVAKLLQGMVNFEQGVIRHILGLPTPPSIPQHSQAEAGQNGFKRMVKGFDGALFTRNVLLVLLRFVTGIVFFVVMVTALALGIGFIALPVVHIILMNELQLDILENNLFQYFHINWTYNQQYLLYVGLGVVLFWSALRVVNGLMQIQRRMMYVDESYMQQPSPEPVEAPQFYTPAESPYGDFPEDQPGQEKVWIA